MTKKSIFLILCVFSVLAATASSKPEEPPLSSLTPAEISHIEETTWRITVKTDIKNVSAGAVQFTVFETDPLPLLRESFAVRQKINAEAGSTPTDFERDIEIQVDWDSIFEKVTGREVFLIKSKTGTYDSPVISSNTPEGIKYLVTKIVLKKHRAYAAWIIPFDAKHGIMTEILLTDKNTFDLSGL